MADYVSILDKAVSGLSDNSLETRAIIYEKARAAIERKLRAMDPVPAEPAIARQMEQLEAAINDVEARYNVPVAGEAIPEAAPELVHEAPEATAPFAPVEIPAAQVPDPAEITVPEGFVDEPILIDGIGEKTAKLLAQQGVTKISQIAAMSDAQLSNLTAAIGYPGFEITQEWKRQSLDMLGGQLPRGKTNQDRLAKLVLEAELQPQKHSVEEEPQGSPVADLPESQVEEPAVAEAVSDQEPTAAPVDPAAASSHDDDYMAFLEAFANTDKERTSSPEAVPPAGPDSSKTDSTEPAPMDTQTSREAFRPQVPVFDEPVIPQSAAPVDPVIPPAPDIGSMALPEEPVTYRPVPDPTQTPGQSEAPSSPDFVSQLDNDPQINLKDRQARLGRDSHPVRRAQPSSGTRKGNGGNIAAAGMMVLLLGAVAAGAYYFREPIMDVAQKGVVAVRALLDVDEPAGNAPANNVEAVEPQPDDEPAKDTSRLGNGDSAPEPAPVAVETVEPKPVAPETAEPAAPTVEAEPEAPATVEVQEEPGDNNAPADAANNGDAVADTGSQPTAETEPNNQETLEQAVSGDAVVLTGEKSYLYEEAAGSTGASRDEGSMAWSLVSEPPEADAPAEPVIKGVMEIPSRGLILNLSIKRNVDPALSASHLIELIFSAPPEFSGGNVDNISRFVMKSNEQARGESLVGVPARIDTGYFLIALNNLDQALKTNLSLLENGSWVDIPVAYVTGRRALITFEKGASGKEVFANALADWKNR